MLKHYFPSLEVTGAKKINKSHIKILNHSGCQTMCPIKLKFKTYIPHHNCEVSGWLIKAWVPNLFLVATPFQISASERDPSKNKVTCVHYETSLSFAFIAHLCFWQQLIDTIMINAMAGPVSQPRVLQCTAQRHSTQRSCLSRFQDDCGTSFSSQPL